VEPAVQYNRRRKEGEQFQVGDLVMIDSKDRQQVVGGRSRGVSKLRARYDGPYKVEEILNSGRDYRVCLDEGDSTFPVFHISKLKLYHGREAEGFSDEERVQK
jgi:hypothetical protein